jgi:hypothetical protein
MRRLAFVASLLSALLAITAGAAPLAAQQGVIAGTVNGIGGTPIPQAQIRVAGIDRATLTDAAGRFRLTELSGDQVTLEVRRIGFRPQDVQARVGETDVQITSTARSPRRRRSPPVSRRD